MPDLLSMLAGGGTGIIGSLVSGGLGIFEKKEERKLLLLQNQHAKDMANIETNRLELNLTQQVTIAKDATASTDLVGSYTHDSSYVGYLRWVRPALTVMLIVLTSAVYFTMVDPQGKASMGDKITYLATVAVAWWFADRSKGKS